MNQRIIELIAADECGMRELRADTIRAIVGTPPPCGQPQAAAIQISLECWRDANGRLHCKLTVGLGGAA